MHPDSLLDSSSDDDAPHGADAWTVLAVLALALLVIWLAYLERTASERTQAVQAAMELDTTLAAALEQYTDRVLKTARAVNQYVAREYVRGARGPALREILDDRMANNDIFSGLAVVATDGELLAGSGRVDAGALAQDVSTFYDFNSMQGNLVQVGRLRTGSPLVGDLSIGRGVVDAQGRPQAAAIAFVEGSRFLRVFQNAKLRRDTLVLLAATDGSVRAGWNAGGTAAHGGRKVNIEAVATALARNGRITTELDGTPRIGAMRKLEGHPLLAIVATRESDALGDFQARRESYFWASATLSLVCLIVGAGQLRMQRRRNRLAVNLAKAKTRLRNMNAELESRIARRTAQLATANRDLQLFTSALAHDVRAPLAAIDGFSRLLEPAIQGTGNERLIHHLTRIRANARHMSELTESMLHLARLSGQAVQMARVDVSALAEVVLDGLRERSPGREVDVDIQPGMWAYADPPMLREVLENLLGNAWKFTGKREHARIRMTASGAPGEAFCTFLVADNGAGFDMAYAEELFRPFHRLHKQGEFAGTGVGLSLVQRVITLHGGRVWAESAPDQGASFRFTLPAVLADATPDSVISVPPPRNAS